MTYDLSDYTTVAERQAEFFAKYPDGRIQVDLDDVRRADGEIIAWKAKATVWRASDDPLPVIDWAVEPVPGKTNFTKDSEAMNASTSAVGRAIVLAGFPSKNIASANEVLARSGEDESRPSSPESPVQKAQAAQQAAKEARTPQDDGHPANVEITFGKHKGLTLDAVPRSYVEWLVENYEPKTPEQRRIYTAAQLLVGVTPDGFPAPDDDIPF